MALSRESLGTKQTVSRKIAALQQIHMAIRLFSSGDYACAITLALAAEDQLPDAEGPYLFKKVREKAPNDMAMFNFVRNWLKHEMEPDEIDLFEFEVVIALMRATSKFTAVYHQSTNPIEAFIRWTREHGYVGPNTK